MGEIARRLIVELIADPRGYTAGLQTAAKETKLFGAEMDKATRGIISGSGAARSFGRSLAFASGGFLAFAGASKFLEDSVNAARDAGVAQRSLAAQMLASGQSFTASKAAVDKASLSVEKYGFTSDDSVKALTVLERGTGSITRAISLQGVAANLARAKNIDLASAANVLAKVFGGQETALRRAVPGLAKHEHGLALIADAERRLAGQARAGTTDAERFHAILHNTEVIIGAALLPTLNRFLGSLGKWLQKMNESGRLQKDVNRLVRDGSTVLGDLKAIIDEVVGALGGWKNALIVLVGAWAGFKTAGIASAVAVSTANIIAAGITEKAWKAALISTGWGILAVAAGVAAAEVVAHWSTVKEWFAEFWLWLETTADKTLKAIVEPFSHLPRGLGKWARDLKDSLNLDIGSLADDAAKVAQQAQNARDAVGKAKPATGDAVAGLPGLVSSGTVRPGVSVSQRNTWFDAMIGRQIGRVQDIQSLRGQVARLNEIAAEIQKRIDATKDITRKLNLEDQLAQVNRQRRGVQQQMAQNAQQAAQQAQQNAIAAANLAIARAQATTGYSDDLAAQERLVQILRQQLAADKQNVDLQTQLFDAEQAVKATLKDRADAASQAKIDAGNLAIQRAQLTDSLTDDLAATQKQVGILTAQHASESDIVAAQLAVKSVRDQIEQQNKEAAQQARENAKKAAERARAAELARQYGLIGLGATGQTPTPSEAALQKQLERLQKFVAGDSLVGTGLNRSKVLQQFKGVAKLFAEGANAAKEPVRAAINSLFDTIDSAIKARSGETLKHWKHLSGAALTAGLGLNREQRRQLEARFATVGPRGTIAPGHSLAFAGGVTINGGVHMHGVHDMAGLENELHKRAKARPAVRRGAR